MMITTPWSFNDPFDIIWKNFMDASSTFTPISTKINYPVDIYETEKGLFFELAVVGLNHEDINILVEENTLRINYNKLNNDSEKNYIHKGITRRSFDLAWKVSSKFDLDKLEAKLNKGLLEIFIPIISKEKSIKKIEIKNQKEILKG